MNIDEFHVDRALPSLTSTCWHAGYAYLLTHHTGRQGILETSLNPHHTPSGLYGEAMWPDILADRGWNEGGVKRACFFWEIQVFKTVEESSEDSFKLVEVCAEDVEAGNRLEIKLCKPPVRASNSLPVLSPTTSSNSSRLLLDLQAASVSFCIYASSV